MQIQFEDTVIVSKPGDSPLSPYSGEEQRRRDAESDACFVEIFKEFGYEYPLPK